MLAVGTLITSCDGHKKDSRPSDAVAMTTDSAARDNTSEPGQEMSRLLAHFDRQHGRQRTAAAQPIFDLLFHAEITDSLLRATPGMAADSLEMLVWYWAGEYFYDTQDHSDGLRCAERALPLTYRAGDLLLQGDCEQLLGLLHFRLSDYAQAIEHAQKSLELSRKQGDQGRISSALNTLAGICLVAKQLDDGERYILEALRYSTQAGDSNRMAIQYGMASEIYITMDKPKEALDNALRAYEIDEARGNTAKTGIRLSQMASAQMALGQDAEAERSLLRAIPILEKAGNRQSLSLCRIQMGHLLSRRGAHAEAAPYYRQAAEVFAERRDMYNESRARMGLYKALKTISPIEAGEHLLRCAELKDSIYHHDMEQNVSRYNVRYKTEQLALQQARERAEKRVILIAGIALVTVLLIVMLVMIYIGRVRRRNHRMLKQVSRVREDFFTNITHEFRTPLTVILGLSSDLQTPTTNPDETAEKARIISRQGNGLLSLINQLLDISKIKSAVGNTDWRNGNIVAYITMIVESYRDYALSRQIHLQFFPSGKIEMDFVPDYVVKVLNNLLSNAFKFTPPGGKVNLFTRRENDHLLIDVSDTGRGMDHEALTHLFEPFYQVPQTKSDSTEPIGSGVGLALVKQIIDAVEGQITVESTPGRGTTFHISVPIRNRCRQPIATEVEIDRPLLLEDVPAPTDSDCSDDNACRLLIIEDNRDIAAYIGARFTDQYAVSYATNGTEGLEKAQELVPDLIITDLIMPGMDGLEVCRRVRANEIINHIPIIVVTAKITEADRIAGIAAGADAYLSKPFNSDELRTRVEKLLEGRRLLQEKFRQMALAKRKPEKAVTPIEQTPEGHGIAQPGEADLRFIAKVTDAVYLQLDHQKDIDVSLIASNVCMSYSQLYRKINALTGYSPTAYIRRIKIGKAKSLLKEYPEMSLSEVAERSGFNDYSNFLRAFKEVFSVTPSAYLKEQPD